MDGERITEASRLRNGCTKRAEPRPARPDSGAQDSLSFAPREDSPPVRERLFSVREAGRYLSLSHWTVREMVWRGELPEVRIGRRLLVDVRDLDELIQRSKRRERV